MKQKRYKCPVYGCRRWKFHLHCSDISRDINKEFRNKFRKMGTLGMVRDIFRGVPSIFEMIEPPKKRRYNRTFDFLLEDSMADRFQNINFVYPTDSIEDTRYYTRRSRTSDGRLLIEVIDKLSGAITQRYIENQ